MDWFHATDALLHPKRNQILFSDGNYLQDMFNYEDDDDSWPLCIEVNMIRALGNKINNIKVDENDDSDNEEVWSSNKTKETFTKPKELKPEEWKKVKDVIKNNKNAFATSVKDLGEPCNILEHRIELLDKNQKPHLISINY